MTPEATLAAIDAALACSPDAMVVAGPNFGEMDRTPMQVWRDAEIEWRVEAFAAMSAEIGRRGRGVARGVDISGGWVDPVAGTWTATVAPVVDDAASRVWQEWTGDLPCGPAPVRPAFGYAADRQEARR